MPTLFLHAGAPKTGTSYLQVLFAKYADQLREAGTVYPEGHLFEEARQGRITSGNGVEMANYIRPSLPHKIEDKNGFLAVFKKELAQAKGANVLYSSEFLDFSDEERSTHIADAARDAGYDMKVIYLVRNISEGAFSAYSQLLKVHGETRSFSEFLQDWDPQYALFLQRVSNLFGKEALIVRNFDAQKSRLAELIFSDILGLDFCPKEAQAVNRSLTPVEAEVVRGMNEVYPNNRKFSEFVNDALMSIETQPAPFAVTKSEAEMLENKFGAATEYVNAFLGAEPISVAKLIGDERVPRVLSESPTEN